MRVVEVEHQSFTVAMLRYLTVNRGVSLSGGVGTSEACRYPQVPVWNLQLFPLLPPAHRGDDGFRDMDDSLPLGHEWDVVQICSRCGGSGWIWETVTDYEYITDSGGQSQYRSASRQVAKTRQVQRTCPNCGGGGRTRHQQILNTWWRYLIPRITHPEIPIPELVENAEEERYFYLPLTVEFESVPFNQRGYSVDDALVHQMIDTGRELAALHDQHAQSVLSLKGGRLYKADFQVCGFRTIHFLVENLGGRGGWFFGKRPEFYFPRLPLCYPTICTFLFLLPIAIALFISLPQSVFHVVARQSAVHASPEQRDAQSSNTAVNVTKGQTASTSTSTNPPSARVISEGAKLLSGPSGDGVPLRELQNGEKLLLLSLKHNAKGWYHVRHIATDQEGWVNGYHIKLEQ
jgi:hypothetical protein